MKVVRHCPYCRAHLYHWVLHPDDGDDTLLHHRPPERIPAHVGLECAACARRWRGHPARQGSPMTRLTLKRPRAIEEALIFGLAGEIEDHEDAIRPRIRSRARLGERRDCAPHRAPLIIGMGENLAARLSARG